MAIRSVDECREIDPAHLAAIDILDLRGPPPGMDAGPDFRSSIGAWHRSCGSRQTTVSRGRDGELPAAELAGCLPPAHRRLGPLPPASSVSGRNVDALGALRAGDFGELTELEHLWLFDNELSELPAGIFSELSELQFLSMDRNRLRSLPGGCWPGFHGCGSSRPPRTNCPSFRPISSRGFPGWKRCGCTRMNWSSCRRGCSRISATWRNSTSGKTGLTRCRRGVSRGWAGYGFSPWPQTGSWSWTTRSSQTCPTSNCWMLPTTA